VAVVAALEFGGQPLTVAATHLDTTVTRAAVQLRQVQGRLGGEPGPRVLLGDLNLRPTALALAGRRGWRPAVRARTFPSWRPDRQLDHVLLSGAVGAQAGRAVPAAVSDHLALVADLQAPDGP
jgi:endonuclease/exonuclease/phosphatase family metal-dependent hydrolase